MTGGRCVEWRSGFRVHCAFACRFASLQMHAQLEAKSTAEAQALVEQARDAVATRDALAGRLVSAGSSASLPSSSVSLLSSGAAGVGGGTAAGSVSRPAAVAAQRCNWGSRWRCVARSWRCGLPHCYTVVARCSRYRSSCGYWCRGPCRICSYSCCEPTTSR